MSDIPDASHLTQSPVDDVLVLDDIVGKIDASKISALLDDARSVEGTIEADYGVALAQCIYECSQGDTECLRCISGQIEQVIKIANDIDEKSKDRVARDISSLLSDAIGVGMEVGIPIVDLVSDTTATGTEDGTQQPPLTPPQTPISVITSIDGMQPPTAPPVDGVTPPTSPPPESCPPLSVTLPVPTPSGTAPVRVECEVSPSGPPQVVVSPPTIVAPVLPPLTQIGGTGTPASPAPGIYIYPQVIAPPPIQVVPQDRHCLSDDAVRATYHYRWIAVKGAGHIDERILRHVDGMLQQQGIDPNSDQVYYTIKELDNGDKAWIFWDNYLCKNAYVIFKGEQPTRPGTSIPGQPAPPSDDEPIPEIIPPARVDPGRNPFCSPYDIAERVPDIGEPRRIEANDRPPNRALVAPLPGTVAALTAAGLAVGGSAVAPVIIGAAFSYSITQAATQVAGHLIGAGVEKLVSKALDSVVSWGLQFIGGYDCGNPLFVKYVVANAIPSLLGKFAGLFPPQYYVPNEYTMNYLCPYLIPTTAEINELRNRNLINDQQWAVGVRANGHCPEWQALIVESQRTLPTVDQAAIAERRGLISYDDYKWYAERNGVRDDADKALFWQLTEFVPGPSDLVRFMVRDAFDDSLQTNQIADAEFPQKFTGPAKAWARAQGMDESVFKYFWRAHYEYPSNTALYTMLHRLRKDGVYGGGAGSYKHVSIEDIRRVLQINDIAPDWIDRLLAISYLPLTRVDARRAYELGDLDEAGLKEAYLDLGYSPENADILVRFATTQSGPVRSRLAGNPSTSEVESWYRDSLISRELAESLLERSGVKKEYVANYLDTIDLRRTVAARKEAIKALKKRYMSGEFPDHQAVNELGFVGVDRGTADEMVKNWATIRSARYRAPTVAMLCDWWSRGLITIDEMYRRINNLGFSFVDAERIVSTCVGKENERREKEAEKMRKEADKLEQRRIAEERRRQREAKAAAREAERLAREMAPCKPPPKPKCPVPGRNGN